MQQWQRKSLIRFAWERWLLDPSLDPEEATGRDTLEFFYELQEKKSPLAKFQSTGRDKWKMVHRWLLGDGRISDHPEAPSKGA